MHPVTGCMSSPALYHIRLDFCCANDPPALSALDIHMGMHGKRGARQWLTVARWAQGRGITVNAQDFARALMVWSAWQGSGVWVRGPAGAGGQVCAAGSCAVGCAVAHAALAGPCVHGGRHDLPAHVLLLPPLRLLRLALDQGARPQAAINGVPR